MLIGKLVPRLLGREGDRELLPRHPELARGTVECRERKLLCRLLDSLRRAPLPRGARVGGRARLIRAAAGGEVDGDQRRRYDDRRGDQPSPLSTHSRIPRLATAIGTSAAIA